MLAQEFIYGLWDNNEQGPTLTGTRPPFITNLETSILKTFVEALNTNSN